MRACTRSASLGLLGLAGLLSLGLALTGVTRADGGQPRILFFTKSQGFEHSVLKRKDGELAHAEKILVELGQKHGFAVDCTKNGSELNGENLKRYQAVVLYATGSWDKESKDGGDAMAPEGREQFLAAIRGGLGVVALHAGNDCWHKGTKKSLDEVDPFIAMIGGEFGGHGPQQMGTQIVVDPEFPGLRGLPTEFSLHEEWYVNKNLNPDMHVLLKMKTEGTNMNGGGNANLYQIPNYPSAWARMEGRGRVFYTSMGHREDIWTNPIYHQIVVGGIDWALRRAGQDVRGDGPAVCPGAMFLAPAAP